MLNTNGNIIMNESKYNEIYDEYKFGDEDIIVTVTGALGQEIGYLKDSQNHCNTITPDNRFYVRSMHSLHRQAQLVQDLGAFIGEHYRRIDPATGLGVTEKQFDDFIAMINKETV